MTNANDKAGIRLRHSKISQERYIKVSGVFYDYLPQAQLPNTACRAVPRLQIKGHWLKQAGFEIDTPVKIRVMEGCLVVTVA